MKMFEMIENVEMFYDKIFEEIEEKLSFSRNRGPYKVHTFKAPGF